MSHNTDDSKLFELLQRATLAGGAAIERAAKNEITVEWKPDRTMVMNLDIASQTAILKVLGNALPIVSEEDPASHSLIEQGSDLFVVDPLDGTSSCRRALKNYGKFIPSESGFGLFIGGGLRLKNRAQNKGDDCPLPLSSECNHSPTSCFIGGATPAQDGPETFLLNLGD